jgi:threonine dehydrogenase-like Zn-dependent dehydrogenase
VIEASGHHTAIAPSFRAVRKGGRVLIQGTHATPVEVLFSDYVLHKEITIIGTCATGPYLPVDEQYRRWNARSNLDSAMALIAANELPVKRLITHHFDFPELPEVYRKLQDGELDYLQMIIHYR